MASLGRLEVGGKVDGESDDVWNGAGQRKSHTPIGKMETRHTVGERRWCLKARGRCRAERKAGGRGGGERWQWSGIEIKP